MTQLTHTTQNIAPDPLSLINKQSVFSFRSVKELSYPPDPVRMQTPGGQTLNDRILAARHSLAGQGLAKAVCKATTEEIIGPKKKHLDCESQVVVPG